MSLFFLGVHDENPLRPSHKDVDYATDSGMLNFFLASLIGSAVCLNYFHCVSAFVRIIPPFLTHPRRIERGMEEKGWGGEARGPKTHQHPTLSLRKPELDWEGLPPTRRRFPLSPALSPRVGGGNPQFTKTYSRVQRMACCDKLEIATTASLE